MDADEVAASLHALVYWFTWSILRLTNFRLKDSVHDQVFPNENAFRNEWGASKVEFADGLLEVIQAPSPPTIDFFKSLPLRLEKLWAVYLLVLEKLGERPECYVGSATDATHRLLTRMAAYDKRMRTGEFDKTIPKYVEQALQDGYVITHKCTLAWAPLPTAWTGFAYRCLFLLLECTFALVFWTMWPGKKYFMPDLCPWAVEDFTYGGLCSHFSIFEGARVSNFVHPGDPRTDEEIAATLEERERAFKKMNIAKYQEYKAMNIKNQSYMCVPCLLTFPNNARLQEHYGANTHLTNPKVCGKPKPPPKGRGGSQLAVIKKKYWCEVCQKASPSPGRFKIHMNGPRHAAKLETLANLAARSAN